MSHWQAGEQAGSVVCTSLLLWWLESAQKRRGFPSHAPTLKPPPSHYCQPVYSYKYQLNNGEMNRFSHWCREEKCLKREGDKEVGKRGKERHFLLFLEKVAVQLFRYSAKENWSLGPHTVSLYKNRNCNFTTKVSINKERRCWSGGLPYHSQQRPVGNNSMCIWVYLHVCKNRGLCATCGRLVRSSSILIHNECTHVLNIYDNSMCMEKPSWRREWLVVFSCIHLLWVLYYSWQEDH